MSAPAVQNDELLPGGSQVLVEAVRYRVCSTLVDSLLHDARNPLNALAIQLEVLSERLKVETGQLPAPQDKSLRAMREQVARLDAILRQFGDFMASRRGDAGPVALSGELLRAVELLGHESRRKRLKVRLAVEPELTVGPTDASTVRFLVLQSVLRALWRAEPGTEVSVALRRAGQEVLLEVEDGAGAVPEPAPEVLVALEREASKVGARAHARGGLFQVAFSAL
ncbi:MAG: histidine kinase [Myxococcaceae bacterium]|nr:histidine kinase [Myxococcaceae bacterium]MCI0670524.1 histidine kinase [Myxococcaceae bacterium]